MSEWITDRRPTEDDATDTLHVWVSDYKKTSFVAMKSIYEVNDGAAWMPIDKPKAYQPPEPDTSLSASIARGWHYIEGREDHELLEIESAFRVRHLVNILEAAMKWDQWEKVKHSHDQPCYGFPASPDDYTPPKPEKVSTLIGIEPKEWARLHRQAR